MLKKIRLEKDFHRYNGEVNKDKVVFRASFCGNYHDIKGCPLGRGSCQTSAISDLLRRTNMESGTNLQHNDLEVQTNWDFTE